MGVIAIEAENLIQAGIVGLAVVAVYLFFTFGKRRGTPPSRSFAIATLGAVVIVQVLAGALLPVRTDLSRPLMAVENHLFHASLLRDQLVGLQDTLRAAGANEAEHTSPLASASRTAAGLGSIVDGHTASLKALGRDLSARSHRTSPKQLSLFEE